jgi:hypothetical protein
VAGAIAAVATAGGAIAYTVVNSHSSHVEREVYGTFGSFGVPSGSEPKEVLARLGPPDKKRGGCWIYRVSGHTFHGTKLIPQIAGIDAVRYCFYSGVVAIIEDHWRPGTYNLQQGPWQAPVTYGCGDGPCNHQAP